MLERTDSEGSSPREDPSAMTVAPSAFLETEQEEDLNVEASDALLPTQVSAVVAPVIRSMYYAIIERIALEHNSHQNTANVHKLLLLSRCERRVNGQGGIPAMYLRYILRSMYSSFSPRVASPETYYADTIDELNLGSNCDCPSALRRALKFASRNGPLDKGLEWVDYALYYSITMQCASKWSMLESADCDTVPPVIRSTADSLRAKLTAERRKVVPRSVPRQAEFVTRAATGKQSKWEEEQDKVLSTIVRPNSTTAAMERSETVVEAAVATAQTAIETTIQTTDGLVKAHPRFTLSSSPSGRTPRGDGYQARWSGDRQGAIERTTTAINSAITMFQKQSERLSAVATSKLDGKVEQDPLMPEDHHEVSTVPSPSPPSRGLRGPGNLRRELEKLKVDRVQRMHAARHSVEQMTKAVEVVKKHERICAGRWLRDRHIPLPVQRPRTTPCLDSKDLQRQHEEEKRNKTKIKKLSQRNRMGSWQSSTLDESSSPSVGRKGGKGPTTFRKPMKAATCDLYTFVSDESVLTVPSSSPPRSQGQGMQEKKASTVGTTSTSPHLTPVPSFYSMSGSFREPPPLGSPTRLGPKGVEPRVDTRRPADEAETREAVAKEMLRLIEEEVPHSRYPDRNGNAKLADVVRNSRKKVALHYATVLTTKGSDPEDPLEATSSGGDLVGGSIRRAFSSSNMSSAVTGRIAHGAARPATATTRDSSRSPPQQLSMGQKKPSFKREGPPTITLDDLKRMRPYSASSR